MTRCYLARRGARVRARTRRRHPARCVRLAVIRLFLSIVLIAGAGAGVRAQAQDPAASVGALSGRVLDSETLQPLDGAVLMLRRIAEPVELPTPPPSRPNSRYRSAVSDGTGEYRFDALEGTRYRLVIQRIGYVSRTVDVDLRSSMATRVAVGLEPEPIILPPVKVLAIPSQPYLRAETEPENARVARTMAAHFRQDENLVSDARELTHGEVVEAATLAETDVFRALQRIPGVSTRDDYTATLWTRGASWDQTRVYFDGLPLYNPTHAGWLFSAVNPDAVGAVTFHPGVRSARWGEGAAAVLDLQSRMGGSGAPLSGRGELSLASARLAMDGELFEGKVSWLLAARRTYVDFLTSIHGAFTASNEEVIPYDFSDLVTRLDGRLGNGWGYTASAILEQDRLRGDIPGLLRGNEGRWGNRAGQITVTLPLGRVHGRITTGETHFRAGILRDTVRRFRAGELDPTLPALESTIRHHLLGFEVGPKRRSRSDGWAIGYQFTRDSVSYDGPFALLSALAVLLPHGSSPAGTVTYGTGLSYHALWGEYRFTLAEHLTLETGLRVERGTSVPNGGPTRAAPRLSARWEPIRGTMFTAGWARAFQYTQDIAPVAGPLGPQLHLSHLWVLAEEGRYSAIRADIATAGVERWLADGWLGAANVYARNTTGIAVPNPRPERITPDREPDVLAENTARGVELSIRRLAGRWTASAGYAYGLSTMSTASVSQLDPLDDRLEVRFPGSADVEHAVDAMGTFALNDRWRVGGGYTFGSGVPYTRLILPDTTGGSTDVLLGEPNATRTPAYASLDLMAEYTRSLGDWRVTAYAQLRNALDRKNSVTYEGSRRCPGEVATRGTSDGCAVDSFQPGIPRLPLIGVRMSF